MRRSYGQFPGGIRIHHSLTADGHTLPNTPAITRWHVDVNHWDDNGYHYLIERIKNIVQVTTGRPIQFYGAHCPPNDSIGICVVGNFDLAPPDGETLLALTRLTVGLMITHGIPGRKVGFHSEHSTKSCPGEKFPKDQFKKTIIGIHDKCGCCIESKLSV